MYRTIETYWPIYLLEQARVGKSLPIFIRDEFEKFLKCGIPEHGFIKTYCYQCRDSGIVAFSCKKRGFCPSCCARRMNDEAAHLVDQVLPKVATRQWVLSFPYQLRYQMARNPKLTNQILKIFIQGISKYQKRKARPFGIKNPKLGAVTFIQRFGSALNLNLHFHTLFADGVFYKTENGFQFLKLTAPTHEELEILVAEIHDKVLKFTKEFNDQNQSEFDQEALAEAAANSISHKAGFGDRAGQSLRRYGIKRIEVDSDTNDRFTAGLNGFSLNAKVWMGGQNRKKLERLIRYMARGPIATERLSQSFPDKLIYKMKTAWRDGTTEISFSYLDFIARLVALIPPPKMNLVRYHGVFAPNFKDRKLIVPRAAEKISVETPGQRENPVMAMKVRRERMRWSEMLKRTFKIDVTVCRHCGGRLEQIAVIKDGVVAKAILESLQQVTVFNPLKIVRERGPPNHRAPESEFDQRLSW